MYTLSNSKYVNNTCDVTTFFEGIKTITHLKKNKKCIRSMLYNKSNLSESLGSTIYRLSLGRPPQGRETVTDAHKSFQNPRRAHGRGLKGRTSDHPGSKQFSNDYLESGHAAQVNVSKINKYKEKEKKERCRVSA